MKKLNVKAAKGLRVPREGAPRTYIQDDQAVAVPNTSYYRRAVARGDLVVVADKSKKPQGKE